MPLHTPDVPAAALSTLAGVLPNLVARPGVAAQLLGATMAAQRGMTSTGGAMQPTLSARGFVLGLDAIVDGRGLSAARLVVWTHLLPGGGGQTLAADTAAGTDRFAQLVDGPHASAVQQEIARLQADPAIAQGSYDLALLRVPAMSTVAIWLQDKVGHADLIVPVAPADQALQPGRRYPPADFVAAARPSAVQKLADTDPKTGG